MNEDMQKLFLMAEQFLDRGGLVGLPTETVYGLAAPIDSIEHIKRIFELKERPFYDPLIVHVDSKEMAQGLVEKWPVVASDLADEYWPGPLTLVLPKKQEKVSDLITSGLHTVGVRCPAHPMALGLIRFLKRPLAAPSANKFTQTSPTQAQHVKESFEQADVFVLDGGECQVGVESTILSVEESGLKILRPGMITKVHLESFLKKRGHRLTVELGKTKLDETQGAVPGSFSVHYRPPWPLIASPHNEDQLDWTHIEELTKIPRTEWRARSLDSSVVVAARELYGVMRSPLGSGARGLFLKLPVTSKLSEIEVLQWEALFERLKKACLLYIE